MLLFPVNWLSRLTAWLRELGPYAALELLLPGGTLILASLWAFRHRRWFVAQAQRALMRIEEDRMKNATAAEKAEAWVVDYSAARMRAIRWLGDRYLLARPINARENARDNTAAANRRAASSAL